MPSSDSHTYLCITVESWLTIYCNGILNTLYNDVKPSTSLVSSGYMYVATQQNDVDAFLMNVATLTSKTAFSCASGFVIYFTEGRKKK